MNHGSLFSGIGGFDLAAEWMGWTNKFHCEINPFCKRVLNYYWPDAKSYDDIKTTDFTVWRGKIDILTGGFPCQPYSAAGKRLGKEDDRHLWPEMLRAIREIQPRWILGENVRGLTNWNGGLVFDEVQADLEAEGYEVLPFLLPACAVNAPHRRDRIWFIAHSSCINATRAGQLPNNRDESDTKEYGQRLWNKPECNGEIQPSPNPASEGRKERKQDRRWQNSAEDGTGSEFRDKRFGIDGYASNAECRGGLQVCDNLQGGFADGNEFNTANEQTNWLNFPTQPPVCSGDDELPRELDGITFSKWRNESIKGYGNAVVPQLVYEIFKAIESYEQLTTPSPVGRGTKKKK